MCQTYCSRSAATSLFPNPKETKKDEKEIQLGQMLAGRIMFVRIGEQKFLLLFQVSLITFFRQDAQPALPVIDLAQGQSPCNLLHKR